MYRQIETTKNAEIMFLKYVEAQYVIDSSQDECIYNVTWEYEIYMHNMKLIFG